jgi:type IV secretory pathway VirB4 component
MLRVDKVIKPWKESASLNDHINLYGFWDETTFLTKSGDVGMVLSVPGVDYESLDRSEQEYAVKRLEAALKPLAQASMFTSISSSRTGPTYRSPSMTTQLWQRPSSSDASSLRRSATIFIRSRSSTAFCSKARDRRPA